MAKYVPVGRVPVVSPANPARPISDFERSLLEDQVNPPPAPKRTYQAAGIAWSDPRFMEGPAGDAARYRMNPQLPPEVQRWYEPAKQLYLWEETAAAMRSGEKVFGGPKYGVDPASRQTRTSVATGVPLDENGEPLTIDRVMSRMLDAIPPEEHPAFLDAMRAVSADYPDVKRGKHIVARLGDRVAAGFTGIDRAVRGAGTEYNPLVSKETVDRVRAERAAGEMLARQGAGGGLVEQGLGGAAEMAPAMAVGGALTKGGGAVATMLGAGPRVAGAAGAGTGIAFWSTQEAVPLLDEMRAQGFSDVESRAYSAAIAPLIAAVEYRQVQRAVPAAMRADALRLAARTFAQHLGEYAKDTGANIGEEVVQAAMGKATKAVADAFNEDVALDYKQELADILREGGAAALSMPFITAPGAAIGGAQDAQVAAAYKRWASGSASAGGAIAGNDMDLRQIEAEARAGIQWAHQNPQKALAFASGVVPSRRAFADTTGRERSSATQRMAFAGGARAYLEEQMAVEQAAEPQPTQEQQDGASGEIDRTQGPVAGAGHPGPGILVGSSGAAEAEQTGLPGLAMGTDQGRSAEKPPAETPAQPGLEATATPTASPAVEPSPATQPSEFAPDSNEALALRAQSGDRQARDELIVRNQGLVGAVLGNRSLSAEDREDLMQSGTIGLMNAIDSFDPAKGSFATHATWQIRSAVSTESRREIKHQNREQATDAVPERPVEETIAMPSDIQTVMAALGQLPELEADVLRRRFGIPDGNQQSLAAIGEALGMSHEGVRKVEQRALEALRVAIGESQPKPGRRIGRPATAAAPPPTPTATTQTPPTEPIRLGKPTAKPDVPPVPVPAAGLTKAKSGQAVLPLEGMREQVDRSDFIKKHRDAIIDAIANPYDDDADDPSRAAMALDATQPITDLIAQIADETDQKTLSEISLDAFDQPAIRDLPAEVDSGRVMDVIEKTVRQAVKERKSQLEQIETKKSPVTGTRPKAEKPKADVTEILSPDLKKKRSREIIKSGEFKTGDRVTFDDETGTVDDASGETYPDRVVVRTDDGVIQRPMAYDVVKVRESPQPQAEPAAKPKRRLGRPPAEASDPDDAGGESVQKSLSVASEMTARRESEYAAKLDSLPDGTVIKSGQKVFTKVKVSGDTFWKYETARGTDKGHLTSRQAFIEMGHKAVDAAVADRPATSEVASEPKPDENQKKGEVTDETKPREGDRVLPDGDREPRPNAAEAADVDVERRDTEPVGDKPSSTVPRGAKGRAGKRKGDGGGDRSSGVSDAGESGLAGRGATEPSGAEPTRRNAEPKPSGVENHVIGPDDSLAVPSKKESLRRNIAAIELLKVLESEGRQATPDEKRTLAQWTGWGGLSNAFDVARGQPMVQQRPYGRDPSWEREWGDAYRWLKDNLTNEEWERARDTTVNAHYTSREVIERMWELVERLGFQGGRVLEPGAGIGHFAGLAPARFRESRFVMVEMDDVSSRLLKKLYPAADVRADRLEAVRIAPGSVDLVIGNVPFAKQGPADAKARYGRDLNLHNYFIARSLDAVKPGGLVVVLSTHNTMDSAQEQRQLLAQKGDLIGAIRLPNTAFESNAKTEVVTDILIFQRPMGDVRSGAKFESTSEIKAPGKYSEEVAGRINEYFVDHPDMVLGKHAFTGSMYRANEYTVEPTAGDLGQKIAKAIEKLPRGVYGGEAAAQTIVDETPLDTREGHLMLKGGKLLLVTGGKAVEVSGKAPEGYPKLLFTKGGRERAADYIELRDAYKALRETMVDPKATDADVAAGQRKLNKVYDAYVKKHGAVNKAKSAMFRMDPEFYRVLSLEVERAVDEPGSSRRTYRYDKSAVFDKRTLGPSMPPGHVETPADALFVSLNFTGGIKPDYMAGLLGKPVAEVEQSLRSDGLAFQDPETLTWQLASSYLSGNVRKKLRVAEAAAADDSVFTPNVTALRNVQPPRLPIDKISFRLGSNWLPATVVQRFATDLLQTEMQVEYVPASDSWVATRTGYDTAANSSEYGTDRIAGEDILRHLLTMKSIKIYDTVETGERDDRGRPKKVQVLNELATLEAAAKAKAMQAALQSFVTRDEAAQQELEDVYNELRNSFVDATYDGSYLTLPGVSADVILRWYQKNAIARILQDRAVLLAHAVGSGKTFTMIGAAMEMRRLGIAKRPMLVVQNATLGQFAASFQRMYPNARVLVADKDDLAADNRQLFLSRVTSGDWDAVVMAQSTFDRLSSHPDVERQFIGDAMQELEETILDAGGERSARSNPTVKELVKARDAMRARLDKVLSDERDNRNKNRLYFDDLHVDALFLDEAHAYKKPLFITRLENLVGLNKQASSRGVSTMMKVRSVQEKSGGRNVVLATGTPITNTLGEAWHMVNFVNPGLQAEFGVKTFDGFVGGFAEVDTVRDMNAGGQWVFKDALVKFINGPEFVRYLRNSWDVISPDDLRSYMSQAGSDLPTLRGGKVNAVTVDRTPGVEKLMKFLEDVYARFKALKGKDKRRYSYIPAVAYGAAKAAALDIRLVAPDAADEPGSKVSEAVSLAMDEYRRSAETNGVQMIFSDIFNHRSMRTLYDFMEGAIVDLPEAAGNAATVEDDETQAFLFNDIKRKLVSAGVPANEIAIVADANTDAKRERLWDDAKAGKVRFLLGSSQKMGVGVNVQDRLVALHHLDAPWLPADVEQREGRILRWGNLNKEVTIYRYGMKNTLDAAIFQKTVRKGKFIWQAIAGKVNGREFDDPASELTMSVEEQLAAIAGDPLLFEKMELDRQRRDLEMEHEAFRDARARDRHRRAELKDDIERIDRNLPDVRRRLEIAEGLPTGVNVTIGGKQYGDKKEAAAAWDAAVDELRSRVLAETKEGTRKARAALQPWEVLSDKLAGHRTAKATVNGMNVTVASVAAQVMGADGKPQWLSHERTAIAFPDEPAINVYDGTAKTLPGVIDAIAALPDKLKANIAATLERRERAEKDIAALAALAGKQWGNADQLAKVQARLRDIESDLVSRSISPAPTAESEPAEDSESETAQIRIGRPAAKAEPAAVGEVKITKTDRGWEVTGLSNEDLQLLLEAHDGQLRLGGRVATFQDDPTPSIAALQRDREYTDPDEDSFVDSDQQVQAGSFNPRQSLYGPVESDPTEKPIRWQDIVATWEREFDAPMRRGGIGNVKAAGIFKRLTRGRKPSPNMIRLRPGYEAELGVRAHEIAHRIDQDVNLVRQIPKHLRDEVRRLDYEYEPNNPKKRGRVYEGWAEFIRHMVAEGDAETVSPEFYSWFTEEWMPKNPRWSIPLEKARRLALRYAAQGVTARLAGATDERPGVPIDQPLLREMGEVMTGAMNRFMADWVDQNWVLHKFDEAAQQHGHTFEGASVHEMKSAFDMSAKTRADRAFQDGVTLVTGKEELIGGGIKRALRQIGSAKRRREAAWYGLARHIRAVQTVARDRENENQIVHLSRAEAEAIRQGHGSGRYTLLYPKYEAAISRQDVDRWLDHVESDPQRAADYKAFADAITAHYNALMELRLDAGALSQESYDAMMEVHGDTYWPMKRVPMQKKARRGFYAGSQLINVPPAYRRLTNSGSQLPYVDWSDDLYRQTYRAYQESLNKQILHQMLRAVDPELNPNAAEGMGHWVDRIKPDMMPNVLSLENILGELVKEGVVERDQAKLMTYVSRLRQDPEGLSDESLAWTREHLGLPEDATPEDILAVSAHVPDAMTEVLYYRPNYTPNPSRSWFVYHHRGERIMYEADPSLYEALMGSPAHQVHAMLAFWPPMVRLFKLGATGISTDFAIRNPMRDWWTFQLQSRHTAGVERRVAPLYWIMRYIGDYFYQVGTGRTGNEAISLWAEHAGSVATRLGIDKRSTKIRIGRMAAKSIPQRIAAELHGDVVWNIADTLRDLMTASDVGPRLAEFVGSLRESGYVLQKGKLVNASTGVHERPPMWAIIRAINAANDVTTNFKRSGRLGHVVDMYNPYFNAAVQSRYAQAQAIGNLSNIAEMTPAGAAARGTAVAMLQIAAASLLYWLAVHDEDWYDEEDLESRMKFWMWKDPNGIYWTIPKPFDWQFIPNLVESVLNATWGSKGNDATDYAQFFFTDELAPRLSGPLSMVSEQMANKVRYTGRPIEPYYFEQNHIPVEMRSTRNTTELAKAISGVLVASGVDLLEYSPLRVDHILNNSTGGWWRRNVSAWDKIEDGRYTATDLPFVGGLTRDYQLPVSEHDFYQELHRVQEQYQREKITAGEPTAKTGLQRSILMDYEDLLTVLRSERDGTQARDEQIDKWIVGLSREALGKPEMEEYPSPFDDPEVDPKTRRAINVVMAKHAKVLRSRGPQSGQDLPERRRQWVNETRPASLYWIKRTRRSE